MVATQDEARWKVATVCPWCHESYVPKNPNQVRCGKARCKHLSHRADPATWARRLETRRAASRRYDQRQRLLAANEVLRLRFETMRSVPAADLPRRDVGAMPADDATMAALARLLGGCLLCGGEHAAVMVLNPASVRAARDVADLPDTPWTDVMPGCVTCAERWERSTMTWEAFTAETDLGAHHTEQSRAWAVGRVAEGLDRLESERLAETRRDRDWERLPAEVWTARAPVTGPYLPGAWRELRFDPEPTQMIPLERTVALHGLLSSAILPRYGHDRTRPDFSLVPWHGTRSGWSVYLDDVDVARALPIEPIRGHIAGHPVGLGFGAQIVRPKAPRLPEPGRYRVRLAALTPVVIRTGAGGATLVQGSPTAANLRNTLTSTNFCARLRIDWRELPAVALLMPAGERSVEMRHIETGGHLGDKKRVQGGVAGWVGEMVVEVNAPGLWLLRCAEFIGLGGRTAYGFGCVRVLGVERCATP